MAKKISKMVTVIAVVLVMAVTAMTATVSAVSFDSSVMPLSQTSYWLIRNGYYPNPYIGYVYDLVPWSSSSSGDNGITFNLEHYNGCGYYDLYALCRISKSALRLYTNDGYRIDANTNINNPPTDLFVNDWYPLNGYSGTVEYVATAYDFTPGTTQYIAGKAY